MKRTSPAFSLLLALTALLLPAYLAAGGRALQIHVSPTAGEPGAGTSESPTTLADGLERGRLAGDAELLLAAGVYDIEEEIALTSSLSLLGVEGASKTMIRRANLAANEGNVTVQRVLRLDHPDARAEGLTLSGGSSWLNNGDPIALETAGGGVLIGPQGGTLASCIVSNNVASRVNYGAGVAMLGPKAVVTDCLVVGNTLTGWSTRGAGVYLADGLLANSTILANTNGSQTATPGGGVYVQKGLVTHCRILDNMIPAGGNADWGNGGAAGAGIYTGSSGAKVRNCLVKGNYCFYYGGGICSYGGEFQNCTIVGNKARIHGGGVDTRHGKSIFSNCIFEGNVTQLGDGESSDYIGNPNATVRNCLSPSPLPDDPETPANIVGTASFRDPSNGDYALAPDSVAIDEGTGDGYEGLRTDLDLAGRPRLIGNAPDVGAFEFDPAAFELVLRAPSSSLTGQEALFTTAVHSPAGNPLSYRWDFGDASATPAWTADGAAVHQYQAPGRYVVTLEATDGVASAVRRAEIVVGPEEIFVVHPALHPDQKPEVPYATPVTAATNIIEALAVAVDGTTIHVGPGVYEDDREVVVDKGVVMIAEAGAGATELRRTGTSGNLYGQETFQERVLRIDHPRAKVEGFTVSGGRIYASTYLNVYRDDLSGAGVLVGERGGTLSGCVVTNNYARWTVQGGGVAVLRDGVVTNCTIKGNHVEGWLARGGGAYVVAGGRITHSRIVDNQNGSGNTAEGGGVYLNGGRLSHCVVSGNHLLERTSAALHGAGLYSLTAKGLVDNCLVIGNTGTGNGGGIYMKGGTFVNCTIVGNESKLGGGAFNEGAGLFLNCIIQGNRTTGDSTEGAPEWNGAKASYSHSLCPLALPTAEGANITGTAVFEAGGYRLAAGSAGFDAGSTAESPWLEGERETDLQGSPRVQGDAIDIGAFESAPVLLDGSIHAQGLPGLVGATCTFSALIVNATGGELSYRWTIGEKVIGTTESVDYAFTEPGRHSIRLAVESSSGEKKTIDYVADVRPTDIYVVAPGETAGHLPAWPYATPETAATNLLEAVSYGIDGMTIHLGAGEHPIGKQVEMVHAIRLVGDEGAATTRIRQANDNYKEGGQTHRVLFINHPEAIAEGLSLENGWIYDQRAKGAGLYIGDLGGTVRGCIISNNAVKANMATYGAGAYLRAGTLRDSLVTCNTNLTQTGDYEGAYGGGVVVDGGTIRECVIAGNTMAIWGTGTIPCTGAGVTLVKGALVNCLVTNNVSSGVGAAVAGLYAFQTGYAGITNCTIVGNRALAPSDHAGLALAGARLDVVNTIVWGNLANGEPSEIGIWIDSDGWHDKEDPVGQTHVLHSFSAPSVVERWPAGKNRTAAAPGFRDEASGDLTLRMTSPCRNAGLLAEWMATATDLAGNPRIDKLHVDIGCYEAPYRPEALILMLR